MGLSTLARIQDQLCTPEQRDRFPAGFVAHLRVPDLGSPPAVNFISVPFLEVESLLVNLPARSAR